MWGGLSWCPPEVVAPPTGRLLGAPSPCGVLLVVSLYLWLTVPSAACFPPGGEPPTGKCGSGCVWSSLLVKSSVSFSMAKHLCRKASRREGAAVVQGGDTGLSDELLEPRSAKGTPAGAPAAGAPTGAPTGDNGRPLWCHGPGRRPITCTSYKYYREPPIANAVGGKTALSVAVL